MKFQLGDRVRFNVGQEDPGLNGKVGTIIEVWPQPGEFHYGVALDGDPINETFSANDEDLEKI